MAKTRRTSKTLPVTMYIYLTQTNAEHVKTHGKKLFGSASAFLNALVCKDRGVKPTLGAWKAKGEAKKARLAKLKKNKAKLAYKKRQKAAKRAKLLRKIA